MVTRELVAAYHCDGFESEFKDFREDRGVGRSESAKRKERLRTIEAVRDGKARCSFGVLVAWAHASADLRNAGGGLLAVVGKVSFDLPSPQNYHTSRRTRRHQLTVNLVGSYTAKIHSTLQRHPIPSI